MIIETATHTVSGYIGLFIEGIAVLATAVGVMALLTMLIVEGIKQVPVLDKLPCQIWVLVVAVALSFTLVLLALELFTMEMRWFYVVGAVVLGFIVNYLARNSWDDIKGLWNRFKFSKN